MLHHVKLLRFYLGQVKSYVLNKIYTWCTFIPIFRLFVDLKGEYTATNRVWFNAYLRHVFRGYERSIYWPINKNSVIQGASFIKLGVGVAPGIMHGCYITANKDNPLIIGDYSLISCNVVMPGYNHDEYDIYKSKGKGGITIGKYCIVSANSMIFSGVVLGDHTIVAGGSVVTKSFPDGFCIIAGNPAKIIKKIDPSKVVKYKFKKEYIGFYPKEKFDKKLYSTYIKF